MKTLFFAGIVALGTTVLAAQAPSSAPLTPLAPPQATAAQTVPQGTAVHSSDIGFSYSLPLDWQVVDIAPVMPVVKQEQTAKATSEDEKKGIACAQIALTARHGSPPSVVVVVALPFGCYGQVMTSKDFPSFATGTAEGLKQSFDIVNPIYGAYTLGSHSMWIERAQGTPKDHPDLHYTVEVACSLLKRGAVCWMAMVTDQADLEDFERGVLTLDGDAVGALVPANAFIKNPS